MLLTLAAALGSDSGIQLLYDRQVRCALSVDPPAEAASCAVDVRAAPPVPEDPTWAIAIAPPGKLFVALHMPAIDWGDVHVVEVQRAFDPVLLTVGLHDAAVCGTEKVLFAHLVGERGAHTKQACAGVDWQGEGEVLLESHRRLRTDVWTPIWGWRPSDPTRAQDVKQWFFAQIWISSNGKAPPRPEQHPYVSTEVLRAWVPKPLPPARRLEILGPEPEPEPEP